MVTVARDSGQNVMTVNVGVTEVDGGYEWDSVTLPNGRFGYSLIVNALVGVRYPSDKMQAILNNCISNLFDAGNLTEYKALQEWRKKAKQYAREALEWAAEHGIAQAELEPEDEAVAPTEVELHPDGMTMLQQAVTLLKGQVDDLDDEQAIEVPALFPAWADFIGKQVEVDKRMFYGGRLWKVLQAHTVQADWTPDVYRGGHQCRAGHARQPDPVQQQHGARTGQVLFAGWSRLPVHPFDGSAGVQQSCGPCPHLC